MSRHARSVEAGVGTPRDVATLLVADVLTIVSLIVVGEIRHGVDVAGNPARVLLTAVPFVFGWLLVAGLVDAYGRPAFAGGTRTLRVTAGAWLGGAGVGLTLRGTQYLPGNSPLPFALVMTGLGVLALAVVRILVVSQLRTADA